MPAAERSAAKENFIVAVTQSRKAEGSGYDDELESDFIVDKASKTRLLYLGLRDRHL